MSHFHACHHSTNMYWPARPGMHMGIENRLSLSSSHGTYGHSVVKPPQLLGSCLCTHACMCTCMCVCKYAQVWLYTLTHHTWTNTHTFYTTDCIGLWGFLGEFCSSIRRWALYSQGITPHYSITMVRSPSTFLIQDSKEHLLNRQMNECQRERCFWRGA